MSLWIYSEKTNWGYFYFINRAEQITFDYESDFLFMAMNSELTICVTLNTWMKLLEPLQVCLRGVGDVDDEDRHCLHLFSYQGRTRAFKQPKSMFPRAAISFPSFLRLLPFSKSFILNFPKQWATHPVWVLKYSDLGIQFSE